MKTKKIIMIVISLVVLLLISTSVYADTYNIGKVTITQSNNTSWQGVNFDKTIYNPIVIMGPPSDNGIQPANVRVSNVTSTGFQCQIDEWDYLDGIHIAENVDYIVFDQGSQFINGLQVEAGKVNTDENWVTVNLNGNFTNIPVILAQCVTYNGPAAVTTRIKNVTKNSFQIMLQEEEKAGDHKIEEIHYAAFEPGDYGKFTVKKVPGLTDAWLSVGGPTNYSGSYILANIQTFNGPNTAALRKDFINGSGYILKAEEEQSLDAEVEHKQQETVGVIIYY